MAGRIADVKEGAGVINVGNLGIRHDLEPIYGGGDGLEATRLKLEEMVEIGVVVRGEPGSILRVATTELGAVMVSGGLIDDGSKVR